MPTRREILRKHARSMRREPTPAKLAMWQILRGRQLAEMKWRRQVPIGPFIADFASFEHRAIVECDGGQHAENEQDAQRDAWFAAQGFRVIRFWNADISRDRESVVMTILARCGRPF